jgi:hypothetical protein
MGAKELALLALHKADEEGVPQYHTVKEALAVTRQNVSHSTLSKALSRTTGKVGESNPVVTTTRLELNDRSHKYQLNDEGLQQARKLLAKDKTTLLELNDRSHKYQLNGEGLQQARKLLAKAKNM